MKYILHDYETSIWQHESGKFLSLVNGHAGSVRSVLTDGIAHAERMPFLSNALVCNKWDLKSFVRVPVTVSIRYELSNGELTELNKRITAEN